MYVLSFFNVRQASRCTLYSVLPYGEAFTVHSILFLVYGGRHAVRFIQSYRMAGIPLCTLFFFSVRRASRCTFHSVLSYGGHPAVHSILFQCTSCVTLYVPFSFIVWWAPCCTLYSFLAYVGHPAVRSIQFYRMASITLYTLFFFSVRLRPRMYA